MRRILLTMSRSYREWSTVRSVLATIHERYPNAVLVHFLDPESKTKGAFHCADLAVAAGIPTLIYRQGVAGVESHNLAEVPA